MPLQNYYSLTGCVSSVMDISLESGTGELSSNPGLLCCIYFHTNPFPLSYELNNVVDWTL